VSLSRRRFLQASAATVLLRAPGARAAGRPNVLLLVIDSLRADHVGAYGARTLTPSIDSLAAAGLRFTRAFPEAMATVPARRSIMSGRRIFPFRHYRRRADLNNTPGWEPIADLHGTFPATLRRAGYWTAYVTDNPFLGFTDSFHGFRGTFDHFAKVRGQVRPVRSPSAVSLHRLHHWLPPDLRTPHAVERVRSYLANTGNGLDETRSCAARVYTSAARLLDEAVTRQPFALVVDSFDPHEPWTPPRKYLDLYGDPGYHGPEPSTARYLRSRDYTSKRLVDRMRQVYSAEVTMTDHWLGVFLERFHALGLDQSTVILLLSDHGFLLGEYGWTGKIASMLHPELTRVPFLLVDPGRRAAGLETSYFASTHDVGPTLLSMAGVPVPDAMQGVDLSPLLAGVRPPRRRYHYGGYANNFYVRTNRWAMMADNRPLGRKLFDLKRDPHERHNVAREHEHVLDELYHVVVERTGGPLPFYRD
jgi:arylsulfatase A-like enzyme